MATTFSALQLGACMAMFPSNSLYGSATVVALYCTATVQLAMFRTDLDLRQAKLGLCTTKDETELLTGCLSIAIHKICQLQTSLKQIKTI